MSLIVLVIVSLSLIGAVTITHYNSDGTKTNI